MVNNSISRIFENLYKSKMQRSILLTVFGFISIMVSAQKNEQPKPFLEDIVINLTNVRDVAIFANEVYFTLQSRDEEFSAILCTKKENGKWNAPQVASFSGQSNDLEPFISSDGLILYFASNRSNDSLTIATKDYDIWYTKRSSLKDVWQKPINLGSPVNTKYNEFYPSLSTNNNLYYTSDRPDSKGKDDIYMSSYSNGKYSDPVSLSDSINTVGYEFNAFIAPDESYIIYTGYNRKEGIGSGDLYISVKGKNGNWSDSKNLGSVINSARMDYCPFVDTKTGTLYFTSRRNAVQTQYTTSQTLEQLLLEFNKYENGTSRLYQVNIKSWIKN